MHVQIFWRASKWWGSVETRYQWQLYYFLLMRQMTSDKGWMSLQRSYRGYLIFDSLLCIFSEGILKTNELTFEEVKKRLEEQHAQQLSILIAEQEREQEELKVRSIGKIISKDFVLSGSNLVWMYILLLCRIRKIVSWLNLPFVGTGREEEKFKSREGYYNGNRNFQSEY